MPALPHTGSTTIRLMTIINGGKLAIWDFEKDTKVISKCHKYDNLKVSGLEGSIVKLLNDPNQPSLFLALSTKTALVSFYWRSRYSCLHSKTLR